MRPTCLLPLLLAACATGAGPADLSSRLLAVHARERAAVGVPPLRWDPALAADADRWARNLARSGRLAHEPGINEGENLWSGTRGAFTPEQMAGAWVAERTAFRAGARDLARTGHYTQMVWRGTTAMGCALAAGAGQDVLVCRYSPPGNIAGRSPF
ncbi:CAP domain-containing protein [Roseomonas populi]|uniref:CAP domain-containing protein n=1 Tax=Roseomonas populi TaxID=3121582 RepID=A0ABT1X843_9PROT|nr:CAP domain-containing protein [Roseomonas pecuniae]MCR0984269.1 CAP domain-containing protein [Roseomonas pecuniae]